MEATNFWKMLKVIEHMEFFLHRQCHFLLISEVKMNLNAHCKINENKFLISGTVTSSENCDYFTHARP